MKEISYDLYYQSEAESSTFVLSANYVFANKEGSEVVILCKGLENDTWVIQTLPVD